MERDARSAGSDGHLFVNAPAGPVFTPTGGAFKSMPSPKVTQSSFDYAKVPKESSSPSGVVQRRPKTPPMDRSVAPSYISEGK